MDATREYEEQYGGLIKEMWDQGKGVPDIFRKTGVPEYQVRIILKRMGVSSLRRSGKEEYWGAVQEMIQEGMSLKEISFETGVAYTTLVRWTHQEGVDTQALSWNIQRYEQHIEEIKSRYAQGETIKAIASSMNMGEATVSRWLTKAGVAIKSPQGRRQGQTPKKTLYLDEVLELHNQGMSLQKIAKALAERGHKVSSSTVGIWLRDEGYAPIYGTTTDTTKQAKRQQREERDAALIADYMDGIIVTELAKKYDLNKSTVNKKIRAAGVYGKGGKTVQDQRMAVKLVDLYLSGKSLQEICQETGKSFYVVRGAITDAGIEIVSSWDRKTPEQIALMRQKAHEATQGKKKRF